MRHGLVLLCMLSMCTIGNPFSSHTVIAAEQPAYAKWGKLAVSETKEKYPNATVVDYLHVGRKQHANATIETFKLWLKADKKEFGVFVTITFNTATEQIVDITFQETPR